MRFGLLGDFFLDSFGIMINRNAGVKALCDRVRIVFRFLES